MAVAREARACTLGALGLSDPSVWSPTTVARRGFVLYFGTVLTRRRLTDEKVEIARCIASNIRVAVIKSVIAVTAEALLCSRRPTSSNSSEAVAAPAYA